MKNEKRDYIAEFEGQLTLKKAQEVFGKEKGLEAYKKAAELSGQNMETLNPELTTLGFFTWNADLIIKINTALNQLK